MLPPKTPYSVGLWRKCWDGREPDGYSTKKRRTGPEVSSPSKKERRAQCQPHRALLRKRFHVGTRPGEWTKWVFITGRREPADRALLTNIHEQWTTGMRCTGVRGLAQERWDQADDNHDSDFDTMIPI